MEKSPRLQSYLSVHHFLQDLYKFRKETNDAFSYETWAQELGIRNRSYLRLIVLGKRPISENILSALAKSLGLNESEKEQLFFLSLYSQTENQEQKSLYGKRFVELIRKQVSPSEPAAQTALGALESVVLALNESELAALATELRDFVQARFAKHSSKVNEGRILYKICLNQVAQPPAEEEIKAGDTSGLV